MVMRITENMKMNNAVWSLGKVQVQYDAILEQMATQKRINRISDDPTGMTMLMTYRQNQASIVQYQKNVDNSNGWLSMTESKLTSAQDLLTRAKELAIGQGTATATAESRRIAANNVEQLRQEMLSLANSMYGDRYLFSGSRMDAPPFVATAQPASIDSPLSSSSNIFDGTVTAGGTYTGDINKSYVVKIVNGGNLTDASYMVSADGGITWGTEQTDLDTGTVGLPDGISLTVTNSGTNNLAAGDMFTIRTFAAGNYQGNATKQGTEIGKGTTIDYNITGAEAFAGWGGGVDIFKTLDDLKTSLSSNDAKGITAQLDNLTSSFNQINLSIARIGGTMNRTEIAKSNLQDFNLQLTDLSSKTEDADIAALATSLSMKEIAMQASYATVAKIGSTTILDFLK